MRNKLTTLELPEGVIYVGGNAFKYNGLTSVKFPKTLMQIASQAFGNNEITVLDFPEKTDYPFQVDAGAFGVNKIQIGSASC